MPKMFKLALFTQPRKDGPRPPIHSTEMKNLQPAIIWGRSLYSEKASPHELTPVAKFNHFSQKQSLPSPSPDPHHSPPSPPRPHHAKLSSHPGSGNQSQIAPRRQQLHGRGYLPSAHLTKAADEEKQISKDSLKSLLLTTRDPR